MNKSVPIEDSGTEQETVTIQTKLHLWWIWLRIAARNCGTAMRARSEAVEPLSFEAEVSAKLSREFESSMVTISAVAFAMEALKKEFEANGFQLNKSCFLKPKKTNTGFFVGHQLIQIFKLRGEFTSQLPSRLEGVFQLRNDCVHFESVIRNGTKPHPSGQKTSEECTIFTSEECLNAINLSHQILRECKSSVEKGRYQSVANSVPKSSQVAWLCLMRYLQIEGISLGEKFRTPRSVDGRVIF